jgi:hypothetical protein
VSTTLQLPTTSPAPHCATCGRALDERPFDEFSFADVTSIRPGQLFVLARFVLPPQYCGTLQCFAQYTNRLASDQQYTTAGFEWALRTNGRPMAPYHAMRFIVNPWGWGNSSAGLRLDEGATVELVVRQVGVRDPNITEIGGRISGRYWYNELYGGKGLL